MERIDHEHTGGRKIHFNNTDFGTFCIEDLIDPSQTFTITNSGDSLLELGALEITGDFFLLGLFPTSVLPGESTEFTIGMDISTAGAKTGTASFTTNTPDSPYTFDLSGNVVICDVAAGIPEPGTFLLTGLASLVAMLPLRRRQV